MSYDGTMQELEKRRNALRAERYEALVKAERISRELATLDAHLVLHEVQMRVEAA